MTVLTTRTGLAGSRMTSALTDAPVGPYPLIEAAFGWNERRPDGWRRLGADPRLRRCRYLPLVETEAPAAAVRLTRLLSGLTWAITSGPGATPGPERGPVTLRVEVPTESYHRVIRALTGAWRTACGWLDGPATAAAHLPAALAVWRMAVLLIPSDCAQNTLTLYVRRPTTAGMLHVAAHKLGLPHTVDLRHGGATVRVKPRDVLRSLTECGSHV